jgi:hypothetical protein
MHSRQAAASRDFVANCCSDLKGDSAPTMWLQVRDMNEHLRLGVQLPVLPLSIVRGTAPATCEQRAREFSAFLAAALSHKRLRLTPALLQLLAPDDTSLLPPLGASENDRCALLQLLAPDDKSLPPPPATRDVIRLRGNVSLRFSVLLQLLAPDCTSLLPPLSLGGDGARAIAQSCSLILLLLICLVALQ